MRSAILCALAARECRADWHHYRYDPDPTQWGLNDYPQLDQAALSQFQFNQHEQFLDMAQIYTGGTATPTPTPTPTPSSQGEDNTAAECFAALASCWGSGGQAGISRCTAAWQSSCAGVNWPAFAPPGGWPFLNWCQTNGCSGYPSSFTWAKSDVHDICAGIYASCIDSKTCASVVCLPPAPPHITSLIPPRSPLRIDRACRPLAIARTQPAGRLRTRCKRPWAWRS